MDRHTDAPSPEYRRCPVTSRWVILAPGRAGRPITLAHTEPHRRHDLPTGHCPFCQGNEAETPAEIDAVRPDGSPPNGPGWHLRVVPNKFPAVLPLPHDTAANPENDGFFEAMPGFGFHELLIEYPRHESNPVRLTDAEFAAVLRTYRDRIVAHTGNDEMAYVTVFKNVGAEAGASIDHLHSQIVATPVVPDLVRSELAKANDFYGYERECAYCVLLRREREAATRVVLESERFVAVCPFAPRFAYEMWLLPKAHDSRFEVSTDADLFELGVLFRRVLAALDLTAGSPAYNYFLHTGPLRVENLPYYHWHVEITPRTARAAGFEWASGCFINTVPPEQAAAALRARIV